MSSEIAIKVRNLSKAFPIYEKAHHRLLQMLTPGAKRAWFREFQALTDVTFDVYRGETVGIVGRNGSGKSTILQIICGTLSPSKGEAVAHGRIAALLELGAGFSPDFTGRENVFLYGTVLGLTRSQVEQRFDEIAAFADIGDFIDQPVKCYSSGMYVRLAFAVAINVMPDILIVDEALAVGDEAFQRKCFARIERIRDSGATVIFVSHSASTVLDICDRAILLDRGELLGVGHPKKVIEQYQKLLYAPFDKGEQIRTDIRQELAVPSVVREAIDAPAGMTVAVPSSISGDPDHPSAYWEDGLEPASTIRYASQGASISDAHIEDIDGRRVNVLRSGEDYVYAYTVYFGRTVTHVRCGMMIKTITGVEVGGAVTTRFNEAVPIVEANSLFRASFRFTCLVGPGTYFLNAGVLGTFGDAEDYLDRHIDVAMFRVMADPKRLATGLVDLNVVPALLPQRSRVV
jgi:lipopolysaccharide transport system ATP-binding protein